MKKFFLLTLVLICSLSVFAKKSQDIVYINGSKYYIHTVKKGETFYSLFKTYDVEESVIKEHNAQTLNGLKTDDKLKIPVVDKKPNKISARKLRRTYNQHIVSKGETLYAISRKYSIPISTIIEDNESIDPIHLQLGEVILIRKKKVGTESESASTKEWVEYKSDLNSVANSGEAYHLVKAGETFYSLARRFQITEEELSAINNGLKVDGLKSGAIIKVPNINLKSEGEIADENIIPDVKIDVDINFTSLPKGKDINIALLLPMSLNGTPNSNYLEFYQGFLLGLDSVRYKYGHSAKVTLFDTESDNTKIHNIVKSYEFLDANLIVGPIYENELSTVLNIAEQRGIPVVSPLANITSISSDVLFQMAPATTTKQSKIKDILDGRNVRVTLIYANENDANFEREILPLLEGGVKHRKYVYRYQRDERAGTTSTDMTPILIDTLDSTADIKRIENVFIIMSSNEVEVDRILAGIASAYTNIVSRGRTAPKYSIIGNARWNRYKNIDRTIFFKNHISFISTYHAKRDSGVIVELDRSYIKSFSSLPTMFTYRGYDAAMIFVPGMYGDIEYDMEDRRYTPLQTTYIFNKNEGSSNHVNQNWPKVNYNRDFTITIE